MELNLRLSKAKAFLQTRASSKKSCSARTARGACSPSQCGKCIGGRFQGGEAILDLCTADLIVTAAGVLDACHVGGECIAAAPHSAAGKALRVASAALQDCREHRHDYRCHCPCECHDADASGADCDDRLRAAKSKGQTTASQTCWLKLPSATAFTLQSDNQAKYAFSMTELQMF